MNGRLNAIASMEFGKAVERLRKEKEERIRTTLAEIWVGLLEGTNGGTLTRQHVDFIKTQVQGAAAARRNSLMTGPPMAPNQTAVAGHVSRQMQGVEARVYRDLELRLLRQAAGLSKGEQMKEGIHLTVQNAANINLGSQVGTINAAVTVIAEQGQSEVANAIRELSEAILRSNAMQDSQKQEALQVVTDLAKQAEAKPEARSKGTVKALIAGLPTLIKAATDLTALWEKWGPIIRAHFGV